MVDIYLNTKLSQFEMILPSTALSAESELADISILLIIVIT